MRVRASDLAPSPRPPRRLGFALAAVAALLATTPAAAGAAVVALPAETPSDFGERELGTVAESTLFLCADAFGSPPNSCDAGVTFFLEEGLAPPFYLIVFREVIATGAITSDRLPATLEPGERLHLVVQWVVDRVGEVEDFLRLRIDDPPLAETRYHGTGTASGICPFVGALCLGAGGRFKVEGRFLTNTARSGVANPVQLTQDTGYLWFFSASNVEAVVKVLNGCALNSRFWVFAGGLTNVRTLFTVTDLQAGQVRTYINPQNRPFQPIQHTSAFATCP